MKQSTIGVLIDKKNYSESSLILSFYTQDYGLSSFIFKGAKKKQMAIFQMGIYEINYFKRPESSLGIIQTLNPAVVLNDVFANPQKLIVCFFLADVLKATLKEEQADKQIFEFIKNQILHLEVKNDLLGFPICFLTEHIQNLGFSPSINVSNANGFDLKMGKFTEEQTEFNASSIQLLFSAFQGLSFDSDKKTTQDALLILLDYCKLHLPNFNVDRSLQVIRETLYV